MDRSDVRNCATLIFNTLFSSELFCQPTDEESCCSYGGFPRTVTHCLDRAVPEAVGKEGVGRGEVKMLDRPPGDRRQVSNKRLNIMGEGE